MSFEKPCSYIYSKQIKVVFVVILSLLVLFVDEITLPACASDEFKSRLGMASVFGTSFNASEQIDFLMAVGIAQFDYEKIWRHWAPDGLRFKVEAAAGSAVGTRPGRFLGSLSMFAQYYVPSLQGANLQPFAELGIGAMYMDFHLEGQGTRVNFNPQLGVGMDYTSDSGQIYFGAIRLHHISNANLHAKNRGINSVDFMLGFYF